MQCCLTVVWQQDVVMGLTCVQHVLARSAATTSIMVELTHCHLLVGDLPDGTSTHILSSLLAAVI